MKKNELEFCSGIFHKNSVRPPFGARRLMQSNHDFNRANVRKRHSKDRGPQAPINDRRGQMKQKVFGVRYPELGQ